jgi:hypothetical protein
MCVVGQPVIENKNYGMMRIDYEILYLSRIWTYTCRVYGRIRVAYMDIYEPRIWTYTSRVYGRIPASYMGRITDMYDER